VRVSRPHRQGHDAPHVLDDPLLVVGRLDASSLLARRHRADHRQGVDLAQAEVPVVDADSHLFGARGARAGVLDWQVKVSGVLLARW